MEEGSLGTASPAGGVIPSATLDNSKSTDHGSRSLHSPSTKVNHLQRQPSASRRPGPAAVAAVPIISHEQQPQHSSGVQEQSRHVAPTAEQESLPSDLTQLWHQLKHLESAVASHMQVPRSSTTDSSRQGNMQAHAAGPGPSSSSSILDALSSGVAGRRGHGAYPSSGLHELGCAEGGSVRSHAAPAAGGRAGHRSSSSSTSVQQDQARLQASLSLLKSEIADKAVKEVEAQLLQQRVTHLEAVLAGLTSHAGFVSAAGGVSTGGCGTCMGSMAGSIQGPAGPFGGGSPYMQQQRLSTPTRLEGASAGNGEWAAG